MKKKIASWLLAGAVLVIGGSALAATNPISSTLASSSDQPTTTAVQPVNDNTDPNQSPPNQGQNQAPGQSQTPGQNGTPQGQKPGPGLGNVVHGQFTFKTQSGSIENVTVDRGTVSSYDSSHISLTRVDGVTVSFSIDSSTKIMPPNSTPTVGQKVTVFSNNGVAKRIASPPAQGRGGGRLGNRTNQNQGMNQGQSQGPNQGSNQGVQGQAPGQLSGGQQGPPSNSASSDQPPADNSMSFN